MKQRSKPMGHNSLATIDPMNAAIGFLTEVAAYSRPFCQSPSALGGSRFCTPYPRVAHLP